MAETYDFSGLPSAKNEAVPHGTTPQAGQYDFSGVDQIAAEEKYGSTPQQALAAAEGFARGISFGASDLAAVGLGLMKPEDVKGRMDANPWISGGSTVIGAAIPAALTFGASAPEEAAAIAGTQAVIRRTIAQKAEQALLAKGLSPLAARATALSAEGAVYGAGQLNTDYALGDLTFGDPKLAAKKIAATIGFGAALGGGLGLLSKGVEASPMLYKKAFGKADGAAAIKTPGAAGAATEAEIKAGIGAEAPTGKTGEVIHDVPDMGIAPSSLRDIEKKLADSKFSGQTYEVPSKPIVDDIVARVGGELENPVHNLQIDSLSSQSKRDLYKTALEMPGKASESLRNYEALQKNEFTYRIGKAIDDIAPDVKPTTDAVEGGQRAIKHFTEQYETEKNILGPAFNALKETKLNAADDTAALIKKFVDIDPRYAKMFDTSEGKLKILKNMPEWGISTPAYKAVKQTIERVQSLGDKLTVEDLFNLRKVMGEKVNLASMESGAREVRSLKAAMMNHAQERIGGAPGSIADDVRETFKRYAINEQEREVIEKVFGASVGSPEFGALSKIKPENILDRIFGNTANVNAAKNILEPAKFNELLASWLAKEKAYVTDKGMFSSNKFATFLKKNQDTLNAAFAENPAQLRRIHDFTDLARILPDSAPINPSGTAKTLWQTLKLHSVPEFLGSLKEYGKEKLKEHSVARAVDDALAGKADQVTRLDALSRMQKAVTDKIESGAKAIFKGGVPESLIRGGLIKFSEKDYKDHVSRIRELASDPYAMMNHLGDSTDALYSAAPNVTQELHNTLIAGVQFLDSKIPKPTNSLILNQEFQASKEQMAKFNRYFHAVNDPVGALGAVKTGTLTNETLEALSAVHPELLDDMRKTVINSMVPEKARELPYQTRISLAKFLGQPLDSNMLPAVRMSYQVALQGPGLSKQQAPKQGMGKTTLGGLKELDLAGRSSPGGDRSNEG